MSTGVSACLTGVSADLDNNRDIRHARTTLHAQVKGEPFAFRIQEAPVEVSQEEKLLLSQGVLNPNLTPRLWASQGKGRVCPAQQTGRREGARAGQEAAPQGLAVFPTGVSMLHHPRGTLGPSFIWESTGVHGREGEDTRGV